MHFAHRWVYDNRVYLGRQCLKKQRKKAQVGERKRRKRRREKQQQLLKRRTYLLSSHQLKAFGERLHQSDAIVWFIDSTPPFNSPKLFVERCCACTGINYWHAGLSGPVQSGYCLVHIPSRISRRERQNVSSPCLLSYLPLI